MSIKLLVDGDVFAWQKRGGISRVYSQILPRVADIDSEIETRLAVTDGARSHVLTTLDVHRLVIPQLAGDLRPWRFWNRAGPIVNSFLADRFWRRQEPDVFHSTYYTTRSVKAPCFCFVYDMLFEMFPEAFEARFLKDMCERKRRTVEQASLVLCISESTRRDVVRLLGVAAEKTRVVYLAGFGSCVSRQATTSQAPKIQRPFLLYVGDYEAPYKNFEFLLQCLGAENGRAFADYDLVVAAPDLPETSKLEWYGDMFPVARLHFMNRCDDEMLHSLYSRCSALLVPSLYEGFGIPVLEALGHGAPVVCARTSSLPEVAGSEAYYFDPRSKSEFTGALRSALADARGDEFDVRRRSQAARFSWDDTTAGFCAAVRSVYGAAG